MAEYQDIDRTLNFAEADIENGETIRLFRDYMERLFLVGYCKKSKLKWITDNNLYAIRPESAKRKGGIDENNPLTYAVDYILLYTNKNKNQYKIYTAEGCSLYSEKEIEGLGYGKVEHRYIVYKLGKNVLFEDIDLRYLLRKEIESNNPYIKPPIFLSGNTLFSCYRMDRSKKVGLVDADLLCNGTRHPNLVILKLAGYLYDNNVPFELILDPNADTKQYAHIFMSRVFTFTEEPAFYQNASRSEKKKFHKGGTGYYANEKNVHTFRKLRDADMEQLPNDEYLLTLTCKHTGKNGIDMAVQMPYYHLYDEYVQNQIDAGHKREKYKDYLDYSIGFLTRKCYRHCPFCVNKLENGVVPYSRLEWFHDRSRPHVYFWDDNFLAAPYNVWRPILQHLIDNNISFQFRQGLDERQLAESPHGEEMAEMLSHARYHGDFIYAFDNWKDKDLIERALRIWKHHCPDKGTKFYLFTGFKQKPDGFEKFYRDIWELFQRIKVLMQYGCVGYVMRHEDYHKAPVENFYVQVARWCNQQQFYKKMSFWEFIYRNQTFWEEGAGFIVPQQIKQFADFERDFQAGYYEREDARGKVRRITRPLQTLLTILDMFPQYRETLLEMFDYKMEKLRDPRLWMGNNDNMQN